MKYVEVLEETKDIHCKIDKLKAKRKRDSAKLKEINAAKCKKKCA